MLSEARNRSVRPRRSRVTYPANLANGDSCAFSGEWWRLTYADGSVREVVPGPEGKDSGFGSVYVKTGTPNAENLYLGSWGDWHWAALEFDVSSLKNSPLVESAPFPFEGDFENHSADTDGDHLTSLGEIWRVIQFRNVGWI